MNWLYAEMSIWAICPPAVSFRADSVLEAPATENWIDCSPPPLGGFESCPSDEHDRDAEDDQGIRLSPRVGFRLGRGRGGGSL